jgi:hypothetical protein
LDIDQAETVAAPPANPNDIADAPTETRFLAGAGVNQPFPERVGSYRIGKRLGGGGMGSVYEGQHTASGQRVAVKLISPEYAMSTRAVERFRLEGRLASTISHPRCVFVLAADEDAGQPYIVMELMPGSTLSDLVSENGPLPIGEAVAKILDVIEGLEEAHRLGVIHRDVKPSNCFLDADGRVKVGDFGLAKSVDDDGNLTRTGTFLGTPLYASPEQIKRQPLTTQADVYSVTATLFYLLTGKPPFSDGDAMAVAAQKVSEDAPSIRSVRPELPKALDTVVGRGLARDLSERWSDLSALRDALLPFLPGQLSASGMGVRLVAYAVDRTFLALVVFALAALLGWTSTGVATRGVRGLDVAADQTIRGLFLAAFVWLLYFGCLEGFLGWTFGKRLFRLRVYTAAGLDPPGFLMAALRMLVLFSLLNFGSVISVILIWSLRPTIRINDGISGVEATSMLLIGISPIAGLIVGIGCMIFPMRRHNGFRGLHEFLSRTRTVQLPPPCKRRTIPPTVGSPPRIDMRDLPERLGPYNIQGAIRWSETTKTLVGVDPTLGREVWVWLRSLADPRLSDKRRGIGRAARLRWVAGGAERGWQWEAFLAPAGNPLRAVIEENGPMPWADAAPILLELADELSVAYSDETLPSALTIDQVWITATGRVVLMGSLLAQSANNQNADGSDPCRASRFLYEVAAFMLEGRARDLGSHPGPVRAPLPCDTADVLEKLGRPNAGGMQIEQFRHVVREERTYPREVTRLPRIVHLALATIFPLAGFAVTISFITLIPLFVAAGLIACRDVGHQRLELDSQRDLAISLVQPNVTAQLAGAARYADDLELLAENDRERSAMQDLLESRLQWSSGVLRDAIHQQLQQSRTVYRIVIPDTDIRNFLRNELGTVTVAADPTQLFEPSVLLVPPLFWVLWSFLTRGGLSYRLAGIGVVLQTGRPAPRWICALRTFLFWLPLIVVFGLSMSFESSYWSNWADPAKRSSERWMPYASWVLWWFGVVVLVIYAVSALWKPTRGLHDRLVGTWLVPREPKLLKY